LKVAADFPQLEEALGSTLTDHVRHNALLRLGLGAKPFPTAFDTGLSGVWAFNLAQVHIFQCPVQPGLVHLPELQLTTALPALSQTPLAEGTVLTFTWDPSTFLVTPDADTPLYIAIVAQNIFSPVYAEVTKISASGGKLAIP
jgi:hypothetical protein